MGNMTFPFPLKSIRAHTRSGTALGIAISGFSLYVTITMVGSVVALSLIHHFFKDHMMDLYFITWYKFNID